MYRYIARNIKYLPNKSLVFCVVLFAMIMARAYSKKDGTPLSNAQNANTPSKFVANTARAKVLRCHDGDTCKIRMIDVGIEMSVRLAGIDAPEVAPNKNCGINQSFGPEARDYLVSQVVGQEVDVLQLDLDPYNRPVVELFVGERNINLELLKKGYVFRYTGKTSNSLDQKSYIAAETEAQNAKRGVFSQEQVMSAKIEDPKEFRKKDVNKHCKRRR